MITGKIQTLESFGAVDGPGIRYVAFLQGCALRCRYCHNPDTWAGKHEIELTPKELFDKAYRYRTYWGKDLKKGGVTLSGGEPLLQMEFATEFFTLCKQKGVHTALDTAGQPFRNDPEYLEKFDRLINVTDLVILDLKLMDPEGHKSLTGAPNENIHAMARYLSDKGIPLWIRRVLVPGVTDSEEDLKATKEFIDSLKTVEKVEILPYHTLGLFKWQKLGIPYTLDGIRSPKDEEILRAEKLLGIRS